MDISELAEGYSGFRDPVIVAIFVGGITDIGPDVLWTSWWRVNAGTELVNQSGLPGEGEEELLIEYSLLTHIFGAHPKYCYRILPPAHHTPPFCSSTMPLHSPVLLTPDTNLLLIPSSSDHILALILIACCSFIQIYPPRIPPPWR